jgi:nucleoid-associated protein YgaU
MPLSPYARYGQSALTGPQQTLTQHVLVAGESIPAVAFFEYPQSGYDSELWRQIAEFNNVDDLDVLTSGTVLTIPAPQPVST